jgi:RNA polymerase sigma factor (TIGR02999 family)
MQDEASQQISVILDAVEQGDAAAGERLFPLIYGELRRRAGALMANERRDHTLGRTALVHEAYLRVARPGASFASRLHFFNTAALAMRRILIDHAATRGTAKRGGGQQKVALDVAGDIAEADSVDIMGLDEALTELAKSSPRQAEVVNLRFFAGLTDGEIAPLLGVSDKTVRRDWAAARIWLYDQMRD